MDKSLISRKNPAPKGASKEFRSYWNNFIISIAMRDNFAKHHLKNLEILCTMYEEYDKLTHIIKEDGHTYISFGRNGEQRKASPEVDMRQRLLAEIRQYSRLLDIVPAKDQTEPPDPDEDGQWNEQ